MPNKQTPKTNVKIEAKATKQEEKEQSKHTVIDLWNIYNINKTLRFKNSVTNEEWIIKVNPRKQYDKYRGKIYAINCTTLKSELVHKSNEEIWFYMSGF